jgi:hypothetical protein
MWRQLTDKIQHYLDSKVKNNMELFLSYSLAQKEHALSCTLSAPYRQPSSRAFQCGEGATWVGIYTCSTAGQQTHVAQMTTELLLAFAPASQ